MGINYKKIFVLILIVSLIIYVSNIFGNNRFDGNERLIEALAYSTFKLESADINIWGEYKPKYMTIDEMKSLVVQLSNELGIDENYNEIIEDTDERRSYSIEKEGMYSLTTIKLIEIIENVQDDTFKANNYIVINITLYDRCQSILYFEKKLLKSYKNLGIEPITNLTITGSRSGNITEVQAKEIMHNIIQALDGQVRESYYTDYLKTVYGYTRHIDDYILSKGEKINMDIAITYDEEENKTYIYGAVPVITIEY